MRTLESNIDNKSIVLGKGLDRNIIKYIAILAMLIDHISMFFIPITNPIGVTMRVIGRLTGPLMCYFLAEGFYYTSNKLKYGSRLLIFALVSQFPYTFAHKVKITELDFNVIFTFFISFIVLYAYENVKNLFLKWTSIVLLIIVSGIGDWGIFGPIMVLLFWIYKNNKNKQVIAYSISTAILVLSSVGFCLMKDYHWYGQLWQLGMYLVIPFIYMYNGKKGKGGKFSKWAFYVFYPLHFVVLGMMQ